MVENTIVAQKITWELERPQWDSYGEGFSYGNGYSTNENGPPAVVIRHDVVRFRCEWDRKRIKKSWGY